MKSNFKFILFLPFCFSLTSCMDLRTNKEFASDMIQEFVSCVEAKDKNTLRGLFSENSLSKVTNFDQQMDDLFNYYKGNKTSYKVEIGSTEDSDGNGGNFKTIWVSSDITTSEDIFRVAFDVKTVDTLDPKNKGFQFLYIIRFADDPRSSVIEDGEEWCYTYWGDGYNTPGINIGKLFDENSKK